MKKRESILIVEDELISATYLQEILEKEGYKIIGLATESLDAVTKVLQTKPDLVLMDVVLDHGTSGCEAAIQINQNNPDISIIYLTGHATEDMIQDAQKSNASAYLMKPYREREILATIRMVLSQKEKQNHSCQSHIVKLKNNFCFDTQTLTLIKAGEQVPITPTQCKLIEILVKNINTTISNEYICDFIWGEQRDASTLRSLLYRTKQTIGEDLISNINKIGYSITT